MSSPEPRGLSALALVVMPERLAIVQLPSEAPFPAWLLHGEARFWSVTRTKDEVSIVCRDDDVPAGMERVERPWRALRLLGPLRFDVTGVIAALTATLAGAGIAVFVVSTWNTDVLLVREAHLDRAVEVLGARVRSS